MENTHTYPVGKRRCRPLSQRSCRRLFVPVLGVVLGAGLLAACGSSTSPKASATTVSGNAAARYFKGKTITLISPDKPGGGYDLYARLFAPYLAKDLGATVNVENINGAGTIEGTNQMTAAKPNGLTLGLVNVGGDIASLVEHLPGQRFNLSKLSWIGQPAEVPNAMITQPGSGITSFGTMLHTTKPVTVVDVRSGVGDMLNRVVFGAFHIPHKLETGFSAVAALKQGFLARDGQLAFESLPSLYTLISGGKAKPLLYTGTITLPSYHKVLAGVPSLKSELSTVHLSTADHAAVREALALSNLSDDFAGPAGIPPARLAVLRSAFKKAATSPRLLARATKESLQVKPIPGSALGPEVTAALSAAKAIAPYVHASS